MARVSTNLDFPRATEEALVVYRSVFSGDFNGPTHRLGQIPAAPGQPPIPGARATERAS